MTKRINKPLPYPYSLFFSKAPNDSNINSLEVSSEQPTSNNNSILIILIVLILFYNRKPCITASSSDSEIEACSENYYE